MHFHSLSRNVALVLLALAAGTVLPAQDAVSNPASPADRTLSGRVAYREELVQILLRDTEQPAAMLLRLSGEQNLMGLQFPPDQDFVLAVKDIGLRLLSLERSDLAQPFFFASEQALTRMIEQTPDSAKQAKAGLFEQRAFLRDRFLNRTKGAGEDLDRALKLLPDDKGLQAKRDQLSWDKTGRRQSQAQK